MKLAYEETKALDAVLTVLLGKGRMSGEEWLIANNGNKLLAMRFADIAETDGLLSTHRVEEDDYDIVVIFSTQPLSRKMAMGGYLQDFDDKGKDITIKDLQIENLRLSNSEMKQRTWKRINAAIAALAGLVAIAEGVLLFFRCCA